MASRRNIEAWISLRPISARAIAGFPDFLTNNGRSDPRALKTWEGLRASAAAIAAAGPRPDGPATLVPLAPAGKGRARHPTAFGLASPDDGLRLAHDLLTIRGRATVQIAASFRREIADAARTPEGKRHLLRTRKAAPPKFSKDPAQNAVFQAEWLALRDSARPVFVEGVPGAFAGAIIYPAASHALILKTAEPISLGLVELPAGLTDPAQAVATAALTNFEPLTYDEDAGRRFRQHIGKIEDAAIDIHGKTSEFCDRVFVGQKANSFREAALRTAAKRAIWNGNAEAEHKLIDRMPPGARTILARLRPPTMGANGTSYHDSLLGGALAITGFDATGLKRMAQAIALAPVIPSVLTSTPLRELASAGIREAIVEGKPLRTVLTACATAALEIPPPSSPHFYRSFATIRNIQQRNQTLSDCDALALYFHARPQAASFTAGAFVRNKMSGYSKFGAACDRHGLYSVREELADRTQRDRLCELTARAVDANRTSNGSLVLDPPQLRSQIRDSHSWLATTISRLASGNARGHGTENPIYRMAAATIVFPRGRTQNKLAEFDHVVHRRIQRFEAQRESLEAQFRLEATEATKDLAPVEAFPHFLKAAATVDGISIEPLRDHKRLISEGNSLDHCVGGYRHRAQAGETMIVGLSSPQGRSTAEIRLTATTFDNFGRKVPPTLSLVQHRGRSNGEPPAGHDAAVAKLVQSTIAAENARVMDQPLERFRELNDWKEAATERFSGDRCNVWTAAQTERYRDLVFDQLKDFLSRPEREMTRAQWIETAMPARIAALGQHVLPPRERSAGHSL